MLLTLFLRRSLENPATSLSDPAEWMYEAFGARNAAGVSVNAKSALGVSCVWRAINIIANKVGALPLDIYRKGEDLGNDRRKDDRHPAFYLMRQQPNSAMTAMIFRQVMQSHALLYGNGYAFIDRDGNATPIGLVPIHPRNVCPRVKGNVLAYEVTVDGLTFVWPQDSILHIRGLGECGISGYGVLGLAAKSLGRAIAVQEYAGGFFERGASPAAVLTHPGRLSEMAKKGIKDGMRQEWEGLQRAHRTVLLEEGMKLEKLSLSPEESQMLEAAKFTPNDVSNWWGIPPHLLGSEGGRSYASIEQENKSLLDNTLDPWLITWEQECDRKLLTESEQRRRSRYFEFNRSALERADMTARFNGYTQALNAGWITRNEVRAMENLNSVPDGDVIFAPMNMAPLDRLIAGNQEPDEEEDPAEDLPDENPDDDQDDELARADLVAVHRDMLATTVRRMARRVVSGLKVLARKNPDVLSARSLQWDVIREALEEHVRAAHAIGVARDETAQSLCDRFVETAEQYCREHGVQRFEAASDAFELFAANQLVEVMYGAESEKAACG